MKTETSKILLELKLMSLINLKTNFFLWYKLWELQDYKVKNVWKVTRFYLKGRVTGLQDSI